MNMALWCTAESLVRQLIFCHFNPDTVSSAMSCITLRGWSIVGQWPADIKGAQKAQGSFVRPSHHEFWGIYYQRGRDGNHHQ